MRSNSDAWSMLRIMADRPQQTRPNTPQKRPETFEATLSELEQLVARMEGGQVSLDESLRLYERGTFLIRHCQERLDKAEEQIEQLTRGKDGRLAAEAASDSDQDSA